MTGEKLLQGLTAVSSPCSVLCCSTLTFPIAFLQGFLFSFVTHSASQRVPVARDEKQGEKSGGAPEVLCSRTQCAPSRLLEQAGAVKGWDLCVFLFPADCGHLPHWPLCPPGCDEPGLPRVPVPVPGLSPHGACVCQASPQQLETAISAKSKS